MKNREKEIFVPVACPDVHTEVIRGVQNIVFSFYDGEKPVDEHIGGLIKSAFETTELVK